MKRSTWIFWNITACNPIGVTRRIREVRCLHLQGQRISQARNRHENWSEKFLVRHQLTFNVLHVVISQEIVFFITTVMRTSNPTHRWLFNGQFQVPAVATEEKLSLRVESRTQVVIRNTFPLLFLSFATNPAYFSTLGILLSEEKSAFWLCAIAFRTLAYKSTIVRQIWRFKFFACKILKGLRHISGPHYSSIISCCQPTA
jgi:hypothetical protein